MMIFVFPPPVLGHDRCCCCCCCAAVVAAGHRRHRRRQWTESRRSCRAAGASDWESAECRDRCTTRTHRLRWAATVQNVEDNVFVCVCVCVVRISFLCAQWNVLHTTAIVKIYPSFAIAMRLSAMGAPCACNYTNSRNPRYVARFNSQTKYDISNIYIYIESSALEPSAFQMCVLSAPRSNPN